MQHKILLGRISQAFHFFNMSTHCSKAPSVILETFLCTLSFCVFICPFVIFGLLWLSLRIYVLRFVRSFRSCCYCCRFMLCYFSYYCYRTIDILYLRIYMFVYMYECISMLKFSFRSLRLPTIKVYTYTHACVWVYVYNLRTTASFAAISEYKQTTVSVIYKESYERGCFVVNSAACSACICAYTPRNMQHML